MILLCGSDISIRQERNKYIAVVIVGDTHKEVTADDPVRALGLAIIAQAGYTENEIKKELYKAKVG